MRAKAKKTTTKRKRTRKSAAAKKATRKAAKRKSAKRKKLPKYQALAIERRVLEELEEHPRNDEIRTHPEPDTPEWNALRDSLANDYFDPIVVNARNNQLVSGHLRRKVMLAEGVEEADVVIVDYSEDVHLQRLLAANKAIGRDDLEGQKKLFEDLKTEGFGTELTGFTQADVDRVTKSFDDHNVNEGDEWKKAGMPTFETAERDIKLTVIFRSNEERLAFVKKHKIKVTAVHSRQFTSRIEDAEAGKFIKDLSEIPDKEMKDDDGKK